MKLKYFRKTTIMCFFLLTFLSISSSIIYAGAPPLINYQGKLTDAEGKPMAGTHKLSFSIYTEESSGTAVWGPQVFNTVPVIDGYFNVILGTTDTKGRSISNAFSTENAYLEITIGDGPALPTRQRVLSTPYAFSAKRIDNTVEFKISGSLDVYYPVYFKDKGWSTGGIFEVEIFRPNVHMDSEWHGSLISKFRSHDSQWGHGSHYVESEIYNKKANHIADFAITNYRKGLVVWLRGNSTYYYKANHITAIVENSTGNGEIKDNDDRVPIFSPKTTVEVSNNGRTYTKGNIGIGTKNPKSKLAVAGLPTSAPDTSGIKGIVCITKAGNMWIDTNASDGTCN